MTSTNATATTATTTIAATSTATAAIGRIAALLLWLALAVAGALAAAPGRALAATTDVVGQGDTVSGREVLALCNAERAARGVAPLAWDEGLEVLAMQRACEQSLAYGHARPSGLDWSTVLWCTGTAWWGAAAENVACNQTSAAQVSADLSASAAHLANMVSPAYTRFACARFTDAQGRTFWAELFTAACCPVTGAVPFSGAVVAQVEL